jgi:hypothetical protein
MSVWLHSSPPKTSVGGARPLSSGRAPFPHFVPAAPLASTLPSRGGGRRN